MSSSNNLGVYYTYQAKPGMSDAQRNCISNIRPQGLDVIAASQRLLWLVEAAERLGESGVKLKDKLPGSFEVSRIG